MTNISLDSSGFPLLLDEKPKEKEEPATPPPPAPSTRPSSIQHSEWARRQDVVRDAAREFEELTEQDLKERLRGLTSKPFTSADLAQFRVDVRHQVLDDLVDVLDQQERGRLRGRRTVRLAAPRGYVRKTAGALTALESRNVRERLQARGWDKEQIEALDKKMPKPAEADELSVVVEYDESSEIEGDDLSSVISKMPAPVVNVTSAPRGPRKMVVNRDDKNLITSIEVTEHAG